MKQDQIYLPKRNWKTMATFAFTLLLGTLYVVTNSGVRAAGVRGLSATYDALSVHAEWFNSTVRDASDGYTGEGYLDFQWYDSWVEWTIDVPRDGDYELEFRYSSAGWRPLALEIDGVWESSVAFKKTGSWSTWETVKSVHRLTAGSRKLRLAADKNTGPNIDSLTVHQTSASFAVQPLPADPEDRTALWAGQKMARGRLISSNSREYRVGMDLDGDFVLQDLVSQTTVWSAGTKMQGNDVFMRDDGNIVVRDTNGASVWESATSGNPGAKLVIKDDGTLALVHNGKSVWVVPETDPEPEPTDDVGPEFTINPVPKESIVLNKDEGYSIGTWKHSHSGNWKVGLSSDGDFLLQDVRSTKTVWHANVRGGTEVYMQADGNVVVRDARRDVIWRSNTSGQQASHFSIFEDGRVAVMRDTVMLWSANAEGIWRPVSSTVDPAKRPEAPSTTILQPNSSLEAREFVGSPSQKYQVGLNEGGYLVLLDNNNELVWSTDVGGGYKVFMQADGNLIIRNRNLEVTWSSHTSGNQGAKFEVDDIGRLSVIHDGVPLWEAGLPRAVYTTPPAAADLKFPARGAFYYPWYPETWSVNGKLAKFEPILGYYSSSDPKAIESHVNQLDYARVDLGIASWWGPDTNLDRTRLTMLMDKTVEMGSPMKWALYYEEERANDFSPERLRADLNYIKTWFAWHPAYAHVDQKPVIFVYNELGCEVAQRWEEAAGDSWHVVLQVFKGYDYCDSQPSSWHQYGPKTAESHIQGSSYTISPGFWKADQATPGLPRQSRRDWNDAVQRMVDSEEDWQLVTTFNEAGEGTMVEASNAWKSSSSEYGYYLEALHDISG